MQWSAIILSILIVLPGISPVLDCFGGDECHQEVSAQETGHCETADNERSSCCSQEQEDQQEDKDQDCGDDCSCSCCHFSSTTVTMTADVKPRAGQGFSSPITYTSPYLFEFGEAVWHPPQAG